MDEVRRFLRFTLPGMAFVVELLTVLAISDYPTFHSSLISIGKGSFVGVAIGIFLGSGAVGFILANLYFALYWSRPFCCWITIDHKMLLQNLSDRVNILGTNRKRLELEGISKREAWTIISHYWWSQVECDKELKSTNSFCDRLVDITHGIGAALVGTLLAFISWVYIHFILLRGGFSDIATGVFIPAIIWTILIASYGFNFLQTVRAHQSVVNSAILTNIEHRRANGQTVEIWHAG